MILSYKNLLARVTTLSDLIDFEKKRLQDAIEGQLEIHSTRASTSYYIVKVENGKKIRKYIPKEDIKTAKALAQRDYDLKVMKTAETEIRTLKKLTDRYAAGTVENVYLNLSPERQKLVTPIRQSDDEFVKAWLEKPYTIPPFANEEWEKGKTFESENGLAVRSKSEALISNKYDFNEIPKRFEDALYLEGYGWVAPDFRVLNVRLRKEFIHEHLGRMDDSKYAAKNIAKINAYIRNGYIPGVNLILTFETRDHPFDPAIMDNIIKAYLQ